MFAKRRICPSFVTKTSVRAALLVSEGMKMERLGRDVPLPSEMQGHWTDIEESTSELVIEGGEVVFRGQPVAYDYKLIARDDDALTVSLKIENEADEDTFQRANITELVITPEGDFHAYNVKFASQFTRTES